MKKLIVVALLLASFGWSKTLSESDFPISFTVLTSVSLQRPEGNVVKMSLQDGSGKVYHVGCLCYLVLAPGTVIRGRVHPALWAPQPEQVQLFFTRTKTNSSGAVVKNGVAVRQGVVTSYDLEATELAPVR